jgi:hypothetical protein
MTKYTPHLEITTKKGQKTLILCHFPHEKRNKGYIRTIRSSSYMGINGRNGKITGDKSPKFPRRKPKIKILTSH